MKKWAVLLAVAGAGSLAVPAAATASTYTVDLSPVAKASITLGDEAGVPGCPNTEPTTIDLSPLVRASVRLCLI